MQEQVGKLRDEIEMVLRDLTERTRSAEVIEIDTCKAQALLRSSLECFSEGQVSVGVRIAKMACEELADRASEASRNGDEWMATILILRLAELSPFVARLLPYCDNLDSSEAA